MPNWSPQQDRALKQINDWLKKPYDEAPIFIMHGDAGTGKTTLSIEIVHSFSGEAKAYAYTGKAASVLRKKGHHDASTFHSDLFIPQGQSKARLHVAEARLDQANQELQDLRNLTGNQPPEVSQKKAALLDEIEALKQSIADEKEALANPKYTLNTESPILDLDLLIADEISMIGTRSLGLAIDEITKKGKVKMLLMGDPNQLPPVKDTAHYMDRRPDVHLTEIHRQAQDNPILYLAHRAKNQEPLKVGRYGDSRVLERMELQECLDCDQVLVGINETRAYYNRRLREERGYTNLVEVGEKLMCLRNSREGFFNGQIWYVEEIHEEDETDELLHLTLRSEDPTQDPRNALVWKDVLQGQERHWMDAQGAQSMVSAQAVTVHKFQGSEGNHVVLLDERYRACRDYPHRHLYTGITRARERISIA